jgi:hypothetical protein
MATRGRNLFSPVRGGHLQDFRNRPGLWQVRCGQSTAATRNAVKGLDSTIDSVALAFRGSHGSDSPLQAVL